MQGPLLGLAEQSRRRSTKRVAITLISIMTLALSVSAFADTYNFFFSKKKGQSTAPQAAGADEEETTEEEAPKKEAIKAPAETSISGGTAPIVIHNNNSIGYPYAPTSAPVIQPPAPPPAAQTLISPQTITSTTPALTTNATTGPVLADTSLIRPAQESRWKMGLSGAMFSTEVPYAYASNGTLTSYKSQRASFGGLVTLGYAFNRDYAVNLYGGVHYLNYSSEARLHAGIDLDIIPFHLRIGSLDLFDFGFIVGASTARAAYDNLATLHAGARLNINFGDFGLTGAARANLGYLLFEAGITTRL